MVPGPVDFHAPVKSVQGATGGAGVVVGSGVVEGGGVTTVNLR